MEPTDGLAVDGVDGDGQCTGAQDTVRLGEQAVLRLGRDVVQHREAGGRREAARREPRVGGVHLDHLDVGAGQADRERGSRSWSISTAVSLARLENAFIAANWFVWSAFAFEYVVRLALTTQRWPFVKRHWADLLIIALPFLRPLRIARSARALRLLRLLRLAAVLVTATQDMRRLLVRHRLHYALLIAGVIVFACAGLVYAVEDGSDGTIDSFGNALWWAMTTVTTVGYGDAFPVTPAGRGIAVFLMVAGIALFGVLTANLAASFSNAYQNKHPRRSPTRSTTNSTPSSLGWTRWNSECLGVPSYPRASARLRNSSVTGRGEPNM